MRKKKHVRTTGPKSEPEIEAGETEATTSATEPVEGSNKLPKLASAKVTRAMRSIRLCGSLARYKPSERQADAMVDALTTEIDALKNRLHFGQAKATEFQLPVDS